MNSKDNYIARRHFFHCDEQLTNGLKDRVDIAPLLANFLAAGKHVNNEQFQERVQSAIEVSLRRHPQALLEFVPHLNSKLPPVFLLTAVYTNKIELVQSIIPHLDLDKSVALSLETAAARNNLDVVRAILPLAPDANFSTVLGHVAYHRNADIFALIYPFITDIIQSYIDDICERSFDGHDQLNWLEAQIQRCKIAREVASHTTGQKSRKM